MLRRAATPDVDLHGILPDDENYDAVRTFDLFSEYYDMAFLIKIGQGDPIVLMGQDNQADYEASHPADFAAYLEFVLRSRALVEERRNIFMVEHAQSSRLAETLQVYASPDLTDRSEDSPASRPSVEAGCRVHCRGDRISSFARATATGATASYVDPQAKEILLIELEFDTGHVRWVESDSIDPVPASLLASHYEDAIRDPHSFADRFLSLNAGEQINTMYLAGSLAAGTNINFVPGQAVRYYSVFRRLAGAEETLIQILKAWRDKLGSLRNAIPVRLDGTEYDSDEPRLEWDAEGKVPVDEVYILMLFALILFVEEKREKQQLSAAVERSLEGLMKDLQNHNFSHLAFNGRTTLAPVKGAGWYSWNYFLRNYLNPEIRHEMALLSVFDEFQRVGFEAPPRPIDIKLNTAIRSGDTAAVKAAIAGGANVGFRQFGYDALSLAVENEHYDLLEYLIRAGAPCETVLNESIEYDPELLEALLDAGMGVSVRDAHNDFPLNIAARHRNLDTCRLLLERGADPGKPGSFGFIPLHSAVWGELNDSFSEGIEGAIEICRLLLQSGANSESKDLNGKSALDLARESTNEEEEQHELIAPLTELIQGAPGS